MIIGIVLAAVILWLTGYFTGTDKRPTKDVARTSLTGAATVVLSGIGVGLESAVYTAVIIGGAVYLAFLLGGGSVILSLFLIALAGCGLLTTVGVIVAMDTFGPVSDNAQGIAEMSGDVDGEGAQILTDLDAVGNTTKAITKGIAIATAVLAATALFGSYSDAWQSELRPDPRRRNEAHRGAEHGTSSRCSTCRSSRRACSSACCSAAAVVFLFSGPGHQRRDPRRRRHRLRGASPVPRASPGSWTTPRSPSTAASSTSAPRTRCVSSRRRVCWPPSRRSPSASASASAPLAGFLAGAIGTGCLMAVFLANSGGSWDNAKKIVEDGTHGGKGSDAHAATVIGDTVGDPFKDTAGPAINPLIKVMNLVSVLIAPAIVTLSIGDDENTVVRYGIAAAALVIVVAAVAVSKTRDLAIGGDEDDASPGGGAAPDDDASAAEHGVDVAQGRRDAWQRLEEEHVQAADPARPHGRRPVPPRGGAGRCRMPSCRAAAAGTDVRATCVGSLPWTMRWSRRSSPDDLADLLPLMRGYCTFYESHPADDDLRRMAERLPRRPDREAPQLIARDGSRASRSATPRCSGAGTPRSASRSR